MKLILIRSIRICAVAISFAGGAGLGAFAQDAAPTAGSTAASTAAAQDASAPKEPLGPATGTPASPSASQGVAPSGTMNTIVVNAVPPEENIMPTSRPFTSGYGLDMDIMDTPRNVTVISSAQLGAIKIEDVRDFSKLTSSSYTSSDFGAPTVPDIRGQTADLYINGMREGMSDKGTGLPFDFNSIESVNIVKGPADAVYGQSQYVGGYVDMITKRPFFDKFQGDASFTVGTFRKWEQTLDFGAPIIKNELAYRISYSGRESGSYYAYGDNRMQSGYLAVSWMPKNSDYTLDFNGSFATYDYHEMWGTNRPTQAFNNNGSYFSGPSTGAGTVLPVGLTSIPGNIYLTKPGDGSDGISYNAQLIQTEQINEDIKLVNNTFGQYINRKTLDSYYYDEVLNGNYSIENRTEVHWNFDNNVTDERKVVDSNDPKAIAKIDPGITFKNQVNTGLDFRYQNVTAYDDYSNEAANSWDLSQPLGNINFTGFGPSDFHIPGLPSNYYFNAGNGDSNESQAYSVGPFWQHHIDFTNQWALNYGLRADVLFVHSTDPAGTPTPITSTNTTQGLGNFNVSPVYKITPWLTSYFTYNYSQYTNQGTGGGYEPEGSGSYWSSADYHRTAELYETGIKFDLMNHTLFATVDGYIQDRIDSTQGGQPVQQDRKGIEAEINYQPSKAFFLTASYSFTHATTTNPGFVDQLRPIDELPVAGGEVQGVDSGGLLSGSGRTPGVPAHQFNFLAQYQHPSGFGGNIGMVVTSPYDLTYGSQFNVTADFSGAGINTAASPVIPWQYTLDAAVFYRQPRWEIDLNFYNLTDQRNFTPVYASEGNASLPRALPFNMEGTVKVHF